MVQFNPGVITFTTVIARVLAHAVLEYVGLVAVDLEGTVSVE